VTRRPRWKVLATAALVAVAINAVGCSVGQAKRELAGGATTSGTQVLETGAQPPKQVYVADFAVEEGAMKPSSGLIAEGEQVLRERPRLLGGGGILRRRTASDFPSADEVVNTLAASIMDALNQEHLGFPAERITRGTPLPSSGWVINGRFVSVDPGNRAERAVVGFGAGAATTEVTVEVDRLGVGSSTPILRFGTQAESGQMPGAAVTMNPYVAAAKFVLGKQATERDVQAMGKEIAKQIADYARAHGVGTN
jgi:Domain of unknown function (DUF4410)